MKKNSLTAALDTCIEQDKAPHLVEEQLYVVMPDKDRILRMEIVLADPGDAGHRAIAQAYPDLALSLDMHQLEQVMDSAARARAYDTWPHWFQQTLRFDLAVVRDGVPVDRIVVKATNLSKALGKASRVAPGCLFQPAGTLEGYMAAQGWMENMLRHDNPFLASRDLRTN